MTYTFSKKYEVTKNLWQRRTTSLRSDLASLGGGVNFKRPFTPLNRSAMAPNPGKHRFKRSPTFNFSTADIFFFGLFRPKKKFGRVFGQDFEELAFFDVTGRLLTVFCSRFTYYQVYTALGVANMIPIPPSTTHTSWEKPSYAPGVGENILGVFSSVRPGSRGKYFGRFF